MIYMPRDRFCMTQKANQFLKFILNHLKKVLFNHSEGGWEGQNISVPYISMYILVVLTTPTYMNGIFPSPFPSY